MDPVNAPAADAGSAAGVPLALVLLLVTTTMTVGMPAASRSTFSHQHPAKLRVSIDVTLAISSDCVLYPLASSHSAVLLQTQLDLNAEKNAGVATRRELAATQAEARDNIFFKEK